MDLREFHIKEKKIKFSIRLSKLREIWSKTWSKLKAKKKVKAK
jgi:hypothetical protein